MNHTEALSLIVLGIVVLFGLIKKIESLIKRGEKILVDIRAYNQMQSGFYKLGEIDLDDKEESFNLRYNQITVPIGLLTDILDAYDPGIYMGGTQPRTRQEKLEEFQEHIEKRDMAEYKEVIKQHGSPIMDGPA